MSKKGITSLRAARELDRRRQAAAIELQKPIAQSGPQLKAGEQSPADKALSPEADPKLRAGRP